MSDVTSHDTNDDQGAGGRPSDRLMRNALRAVLEHEVEDFDGRMIRKADLVARRLVERGLAGDVAAIREIADRTDGKAAPGVRPPPEPVKYIVSWKGDD
jgi:hypothetical protein